MVERDTFDTRPDTEFNSSWDGYSCKALPEDGHHRGKGAALVLRLGRGVVVGRGFVHRRGTRVKVENRTGSIVLGPAPGAYTRPLFGSL